MAETKYILANGVLRVERRLNGLLHAEYSPAVEIYMSDGPAIYEYWQNGEKNRHIGPAVLHIVRGKITLTEYWINGHQIHAV